MTKYLKAFTLTERWVTLKKQSIDSVYPLIEAIEKVSQEPNAKKIDKVRKLEKLLSSSIMELHKEDRGVLEDMIVRQLYQGQRQYIENLTRWEFALQRAEDKGVSRHFEILDDIINKSEEEMKKHASSGSSPEDYVELQQELLDHLNEVWAELDKELKNDDSISEFYEDFFKRELQRKREVIERHIKYFQDNKFGEWLAGLRHNKNWSLAQAAKETGVSSSYIHRIEKGTRGIPSVAKLDQLAKGFGVPTTEMITMASSGIKEIGDYIEEGAFLVNEELVTDKVKMNIADLLRLAMEGTEEESIEQLLVVRELLGNK